MTAAAKPAKTRRAPADRIDAEIVRLHGEGCTRRSIMERLGICSATMVKRTNRLGISFRANSYRVAVACPNGHNATVLGHDKGRCIMCGEALLIPMGYEAAPTGHIKQIGRRRTVLAENAVLDRDWNAILALEVRRESTPPYLRDAIDAKLRELRA